MAMRWSSEFKSMEYRDLQAGAMAIDNTGTFVLLAGRRYIAIKNLDDLDNDALKKYPRQSKYEVSVAEWNPSPHNRNLCSISSNQRVEVLSWGRGHLSQVHSLKCHTRVVTDLNWHQFEPNILASCSVDTFIHVWDIRDYRRPALSLSAVAYYAGEVVAQGWWVSVPHHTARGRSVRSRQLELRDNQAAPIWLPGQSENRRARHRVRCRCSSVESAGFHGRLVQDRLRRNSVQVEPAVPTGRGLEIPLN